MTPPTVTTGRARTTWAFALAALVAISAIGLHWRTLGLGLHSDAYVTLHPWSRAELWQAITGRWMPEFVEPYHRPLSSMVFAAQFATFGLHARALHAVSLVVMAIAAWGLGRLVLADVGPRAAVLAVLVYLSHPVLLESTTVLIHNLPLDLCLLLVLAVLSIWRRARHTIRARAWWPIFALAVVAFYIREDAFMVLPAVVALQWLRARLWRDVPSPTWRLTAAVAVTALLLAAIRFSLVPVMWIAQDGLSAAREHGLRVALYAPVRTAVAMFEGGVLLPGATAFILLAQAAGLVQCIRRPTTPGAWLWMMGAILLAAFSLPLVFAADPRTSRLHLALLSAAMMLTGGLTGLLTAAATRGRLTHAAAIAVVVVGLTGQTIDQQRVFGERFEACSDGTLMFDEFLSTWPGITDDVRAWIPTKIAACASGETLFINDSIGAVRWATNTGLAVDATSATLQLTGPPDRVCPSMASLNVDGATRAIDTCAPTLEVALTPTWRTWMRQAHRIDITPDASHAMPVVENVSVVRSR